MDLNHPQGIRLLSAESLRKAIQIRDEIAKAKKKKEDEKAMVEAQKKPTEVFEKEVQPCIINCKKSPIQPFKNMNGPQQQFGERNSNTCSLQKMGNSSALKDGELLASIPRQFTHYGNAYNVKTPLSSKEKIELEMESCHKETGEFHGVDSIKLIHRNKKLENYETHSQRIKMNRTDQQFSPECSSFNALSSKKLIPIGQPVARPDCLKFFERANSILANALNLIEQMSETRFPTTRCVNDVRAHLVELQAVLTWNEHEFETLHHEKEMLSRQLHLGSTSSAESSDASTFFTPASSRGYGPHCSTLKGIRPLSVSELKHDSSEDDDDTLLERSDRSNSIGLEQMESAPMHVNVDMQLHGKSAAASSDLSERSHNSSHVKTELIRQSLMDHLGGAIACVSVNEKFQSSERIVFDRSTEKQLSSTPKSLTSRMSESESSIHLTESMKWDHRLNKEARVWYHDHVGSRIEKVILEVQQLRNQLHQQTSDYVQNRNSRDTIAFKDGALEMKSYEC